IAGCPKASAPEQVPHEFELAKLAHCFRTADFHGLASTSETISRVHTRATVEHSGVIVNASGMIDPHFRGLASIGCRGGKATNLPLIFGPSNANIAHGWSPHLYAHDIHVEECRHVPFPVLAIQHSDPGVGLRAGSARR